MTRSFFPHITLPGAAVAAAAFFVTLSSAQAASFDCDAAELKADEKVICDTRSLNDADVRMATTFELLSGLMAMGARGTLQDEQTVWLKKRQACEADVACLTEAYKARMLDFDKTSKTLSRPL